MDNFYNLNADRLFSQYQSFSFEQVHSVWLDLLPSSPGRALDIGAGSGRDAAWLADRGWQVTAVEPADDLRHRAQEFHRNENIQWMRDSLPSLTEIDNRYRFELILVSAVWMHLSPEEQQLSFDRLRQLQTSDGVLVITWRNVAGETERQFYVVDESLFDGAAIFQAEDLEKRTGIIWKTAVFR
ncbi:hypothetical protein BTA51_11340 [Hahella sp. CCB-MM4]|uniref:class I SAM-dependent methyltransferase n=1 Tax=Hahella sp. (strain CCB-MM4) TaxID=1926491 RepID=UPI000B9B8398|nr:class I SAM-dependent methyltransferase [Hahella sp. CCB-MM4]OZG73084.1 hypothetical protein BTA51_11340 [Hahella sp. CCB-MM4]